MRRLRRVLAGLLAVVAVAAGGLWLAQDYIILHIVGWLAPPVAKNRPVVFAKGPEAPAAPADQRRPNIVVILADDLGYNDITLHGGVAGGTVPTPNIDAIAHQGARFTNGYSGNATCAPSRASLMTGRYPNRFGFEFTPAAPQFMKVISRFASDPTLPRPRFYEENMDGMPARETLGLPRTETTLAELLKPAGYRNLQIGKWHLGEADGLRPESRGFDESLGILIGAAMFLPENHPDVVNSKQDFDPIDRFLWANLPYAVRFNGGDPFEPAGYVTDYLTDAAVQAIEANRNRPFMMYLSYTAPHTPLQALRSDYDALSHIQDHRTRVYAAMIRSLDRGVGRVLDALKANGLEENTLVFFSSDNGGAHYIGLPDINKPFRGWKATMYEGGTHVPFLVKWPQAIPAGTVFDHPVSHVDIFATAAAAAGVPLPADRTIDGNDLVRFATGAEGDRAPHEALFWQTGNYRAVRTTDWKLQQTRNPDRTLLFDMRTDPTEHNDVAARHPDVVRDLTARLDAFAAEQAKPLWPMLVEGAIPIDRPAGTPGKKGEEYMFYAN